MDIDDIGEEFLSSELHAEILSSHLSIKMVIYGLYSTINEFELHLDRITNRYKYLALTWLLGTFAAIGFFFSTEATALPVNKHFVACIVDLFGVVGILSIWHLDLCVYQKFWAAFFIEEINCEKRYPFLGKLMHTSLALGTINTRLNGNGNFYILCTLLLIITFGMNVYFFAGSALMQIVLLATLFFFAAFIVWKMKDTGKRLLRSLETLIK